MSDLSGRAALVTGAASGIGLAPAHALARAGATVTLADMDVERGQAEAARIPGARSAAVDLTAAGSARRLVEETLSASGRLDILINNAGMQHVASIVEFPEARWRQLIEIMLTAPFLLTQAALPGMYERGWGRIVNVGSIHSLRDSAYKSAYSDAKHAMLGLTHVNSPAGPLLQTTHTSICSSSSS